MEKYLWFKSDDGKKLEDAGVLLANSESEARDLLYELYRYNCMATCIQFAKLDDELAYLRDDEKSISIFELFNERK